MRYAEAVDGMYCRREQKRWLLDEPLAGSARKQIIAPGKWDLWIMVRRSGLIAILVTYWYVVNVEFTFDCLNRRAAIQFNPILVPFICGEAWQSRNEIQGAYFL